MTQAAKMTRTPRPGHDPVEQLASTVAKRLRTTLGHPATDNARASGYGTVCMTGHPVLESLWLQCTKDHPERALVEIERDAANLPPAKGLVSDVPRLPVVFYRDRTIRLTTRLWVLDELRWLEQSERSDGPRSMIDQLLSKLNHGLMPVTSSLDDLVRLLGDVITRAPRP